MGNRRSSPVILAFSLWEACEIDESMAIPSTLTLTHRSANEVAGKMAKKGVGKKTHVCRTHIKVPLYPSGFYLFM